MKILNLVLMLVIISSCLAKYKKAHQRKHFKAKKSNDLKKKLEKKVEKKVEKAEKGKQDESMEQHIVAQQMNHIAPPTPLSSSPSPYQFKATSNVDLTRVTNEKQELVHHAEQTVIHQSQLEKVVSTQENNKEHESQNDTEQEQKHQHEQEQKHLQELEQEHEQEQKHELEQKHEHEQEQKHELEQKHEHEQEQKHVLEQKHEQEQEQKHEHELELKHELEQKHEHEQKHELEQKLAVEQKIKDEKLRKEMEKAGADKISQDKQKAQDMIVLTPVPYNSTFVNASRPLPRRNTPIPGGWEDASLVKQISTYSKKFLRDINDPKMRDKQMLVGKSMYLENNMTFDEQPVILQESAPHMTGVNVVQRSYNTQEKADLWRSFNSQEFKEGFKDVQFGASSLKDFSGVQDVIKASPVRIRLNNRKSIAQVQADSKDHILENTLNPVKRVVFTKEKKDDITFNAAEPPQVDPKRLGGIQGMKVHQDMIMDHLRQQNQKHQFDQKDISKRSISKQALYHYQPSYYGNDSF